MTAISANNLTHAALRDVERASIRRFLDDYKVLLSGRTLDYGCGIPGRCIKPRPYRDLVTGPYVPYDEGFPEPQGAFQAVICTQVVQYVPDIRAFLKRLRALGEYLILTYPTNWAEVEASDLQRFTKMGMTRALEAAGWRVQIHEPRWTVKFADFSWVGGYGVVAR